MPDLPRPSRETEPRHDPAPPTNAAITFHIVPEEKEHYPFHEERGRVYLNEPAEGGPGDGGENEATVERVRYLCRTRRRESSHCSRLRQSSRVGFARSATSDQGPKEIRHGCCQDAGQGCGGCKEAESEKREVERAGAEIGLSPIRWIERHDVLKMSHVCGPWDIDPQRPVCLMGENECVTVTHRPNLMRKHQRHRYAIHVLTLAYRKACGLPWARTQRFSSGADILRGLSGHPRKIIRSQHFLWSKRLHNSGVAEKTIESLFIEGFRLRQILPDRESFEFESPHDRHQPCQIRETIRRSYGVHRPEVIATRGRL